MSEHAVVIAGGGPTGMMLAAELTLAGTDVLIVERRASFKLESSRSRGLHSRTIEVLDQRGVVDRFLAEGKAMQVQAFAGVPMDISDFPTRHNYGMALPQSHFERILAGWLVFSLLHSAEPVLLNFGQAGGFDIAPWAERVQLVDASHAGIWELPVVGEVTAPSAVLVRPDGHVAWVGEGTDVGLRDALTTWFGP
jgi:threonine dehydrogenase-like Zn-dependent dehydrogenase